MQNGRSLLLALSLLSACAASNAAQQAQPQQAGPGLQMRVAARAKALPITGAPGAFLTGRFAAMQGDLDFAADEFLRALADDPGNAELRQQAFLACLMAGRPETVRLAQGQPNNQSALMLLGNAEAARGNWEGAETRFAALPRQGLTQVLQPLLVSWAQFGAGRTDAALATLHPYIEGQRYRAVYALHGALIADLANRPAEAARLYRLAETEYGPPTLQLARMIASWQARQGHPADAGQTLKAAVDLAPEAAITLPALQANVSTRLVRRATDGLAESYLVLASALRQQDATDLAMVLVRLALDLRPDFTAARLLAADILDATKHPQTGLAVLAPVRADDPLNGIVRLRRAALTEQTGRTEEALRLLEQMARDYPDRPDPYAVQGDILRMKHRYADAVTAYDNAVARVPEPTRANWPLFYDRGIALERSHQWERAEADFLRALQLAPDQPYVLNYLGYSWAEQGRNLQKARTMIERAVEQRPNDGAIIDSLGWATLRQGDIAGAVKALERAAELQPEDATINGHLGDAYWAANRRQEAVYQWRRALNLKPEPEDVPKLEAKLREGEQVIGVATPASTDNATP
ncbi:Tetratricopeptide repeat protein [Rhodovastum atsumiense]|uniref:Tetratricopeptide repeat protein n=1 Tax=Rhodovastum atsumiense TaxID=504468 RepID=A0A5M6IXH1_9PROT|nr:tetratricopeptide repeat protein [Rhodovastum atsumiense]KAA5613036.1 tetratricopeptide repeat protein [Rhodovastum atsumiense]CAH2600109.1 Tetratricopeptide repeat protein [Rhodovastum atsumiense]